MLRGINKWMLDRVPTRVLRVVSQLPDEVGILSGLLFLTVLLGIARPGFLGLSNLLQLTRFASFFGIMALGMVFMLAHGEVDLSVGSNYYLSGVVAALAMVSGLNSWLAAGLGMLTGLTFGFLNGFMASVIGVPVLIITLGTLSAYRGIGLVLSHSSWVLVPDTTGGIFDIVRAKLFGVLPTPVLFFFALAIILQVVLQRTRFGFRVQALGSNVDAARLAGIPIDRTRVQAASLVGLMTGIAGTMAMIFFGGIDPLVGSGFELLVISSVIIGGTSLDGGAGTVIGASLGVLVTSVINSGMAQLGVEIQWSTVVTGAVIIFAVMLDRLVRQRRRI
jgi:ribose transport system permease protein